MLVSKKKGKKRDYSLLFKKAEGSTLEEDPSKLNSTELEAELEVDPLFKNMTAKFGLQGGRNLLMNFLPLNEDLDILLEAKKGSGVYKLQVKELSHQNISSISSVAENFNLEEMGAFAICNLSSFKTEVERRPMKLDKDIYEQLVYGKEAEEDDGNQGEAFSEIDYDGRNEESVDDEEFSEVPNDFRQEENEEQAMNITNLDGLSLLRADDIKDYVMQFGDGNRNLFSAAEGSMSFVNKFSSLESFHAELQTKTIKKKKEHKLFEFTEQNEVKDDEVYDVKSTKKPKRMSKTKKLKKRRRVKLPYMFQKET